MRGRPRKQGAEQRILAAALEEYGEHGWSGFTMDGVARRAEVGKSSIYLRWSTKDDLLTEAVSVHSGEIGSVDTGSLRGDLEALAANLLRHLLDPAGWATLRIMVDAASTTHPLGRFTEVVSQEHRSSTQALMARAHARGEIEADLATATMVECLYGAITMQTLSLSGEDRHLSDEEIAVRVRTIVAFVLAGAGL